MATTGAIEEKQVQKAAPNHRTKQGPKNLTLGLGQQFSIAEDQEKTGTSKVGFKSAVFEKCVGRFHEKLLFSNLRLFNKVVPIGVDYYFCFNLSLIRESYLDYQYTPV